MAQRGFNRLLAVLSMGVLVGCASGSGLGMLDSGDAFCAQQYRVQREGPPTPSGLSKRERERYEERTTDYHVSQGCQREAERSATIPLRRPQGR